MKKSEVRIGGIYAAKVSDRITEVRIDGVNPHGGWNATNLATGKNVRIKRAQRLRHEISDAPADAPPPDPDHCSRCGRPSALTHLGSPLCQACWDQQCRQDEAAAQEPGPDTAEIAATVEAVQAGNLVEGIAIPTPAKKSRTRKAAEPKPKRLGVLNAAAQVLKASGQAMRSGEMIAAMVEQDLWQSPNGKTPEATLYAAIIREIGTKGDSARFRKVERGKFEYAGTEA